MPLNGQHMECYVDAEAELLRQCERRFEDELKVLQVLKQPLATCAPLLRILTLRHL